MFGLMFRHAPPGSRRAHFAEWWGRYAGSVAFVTLLVIASLYGARIENARYEGCESGNLLRAALREEQREDIAQTEAIDRAKVFPQIDPTEYAELVEQAKKRAEHRINVSYAPRDCGTHIQLPLTGATITVPLGE